jgi:ParB family transcriptional regulator, chromosome partitioning protein
LQKPRSQQVITVDHVIEASSAASILRKRDVINDEEEEDLRRVIIGKFRKKIIKSTVAPRLLARLSRAVARNEIATEEAHKVVTSVIKNPAYTLEQAFDDSIAKADFEHSVEQLIERLIERLQEHRQRRYRPSKTMRAALDRLRELL